MLTRWHSFLSHCRAPADPQVRAQGVLLRLTVALVPSLMLLLRRRCGRLLCLHSNHFQCIFVLVRFGVTANSVEYVFDFLSIF